MARRAFEGAGDAVVQRELRGRTASITISAAFRSSRDEIRRFYRTVGLVEQPDQAASE